MRRDKTLNLKVNDEEKKLIYSLKKDLGYSVRGLLMYLIKYYVYQNSVKYEKYSKKGEM